MHVKWVPHLFPSDKATVQSALGNACAAVVDCIPQSSLLVIQFATTSFISAFVLELGWGKIGLFQKA